MTEHQEFQLPLFSALPPLDLDELEDAEFRGKDLGWSSLVAVYEDRKENDGLNYEKLGKRIKRSRAQVQRWLSSPVNLTLRTLGLLAEGMDADLTIHVTKRMTPPASANYCHPSEAAAATLFARKPMQGTIGKDYNSLNMWTVGSRSPSLRVVMGDMLDHA
ncbi:MAG: hypothetical protein H2050_13680 [Sphingobium sp.]|uniref:hypothetical protein n=1 Tax=Sphingobium sp. TaxID=1912891 RepID=UPI001852A55F|nr:hypothetical protein [Sphingobium sp.]MBA4755872.1 hypothetical protein [Sphingobium sp.]